MCNGTSEVRISDAPGMTRENCYRAKMPGADADRPTLPGGRGTPGARGGCCCGGGGAAWRGVLPKLKKFPNGCD
jgi:hypothetical protein